MSFTRKALQTGPCFPATADTLGEPRGRPLCPRPSPHRRQARAAAPRGKHRSLSQGKAGQQPPPAPGRDFGAFHSWAGPPRLTVRKAVGASPQPPRPERAAEGCEERRRRAGPLSAPPGAAVAGGRGRRSSPLPAAQGGWRRRVPVPEEEEPQPGSRRDKVNWKVYEGPWVGRERRRGEGEVAPAPLAAAGGSSRRRRGGSSRRDPARSGSRQLSAPFPAGRPLTRRLEAC